MSSRRAPHRARSVSSSCLGVVALLTFGACGEKGGDDTTATTTGPNATASGTESSAGGTGGTTTPTTADSSATASVTNTSGTTPNTGGTATNTSGTTPSTGGTTPSTGGTGSTPNTGGTSPGTTTGSGGTDDPGSTGGTGAMGGTDDPGDPDAGGSGGDGTAGAGGSGGETSGGSGGDGGAGQIPSGECTRELLDSVMDDYFAALSAGDPSSLPLAANVKFTENAQESEIGTTDFWMNAGDTKYSQRALDTTVCSAAAQAVVPEGTTDLVIAVRIKLEGGELTEIETIVFREGDYTASYSVPSDPQAIIDSADAIGWHDEIPEADRTSREELGGWIDKYFRAFPNGVCNVSDSCRRLENGGGDFDCDGFSGCSAGDPGAGTMTARLIIVDEVRGIAAGLANFDYMADGHLDMHMIKMSGSGEVLAVHAILRDTDGQSGWD